jgi:tRNA threonylcarbamoyladenosine modification (KEOPS) complex Cgi121 subunit
VIFEISKIGRHVWLSAFDSRPENLEQLFQNIAQRYPNIGVQLVDLDRVPGRRYLMLATVNAAMSFRSGRPIAKTLSMEILLFIAGEKQINVALKKIGVVPQTRRIIAVAVGEGGDEFRAAINFIENAFGKEANDGLTEDWPAERVSSVRSGYNIAEPELKAVTRKGEALTSVIERLAIERSALVAAKK